MTPVVLLGGEANSLSVARSLGRQGVPVHALTARDSHVRYSRYASWIPCPSTGDGLQSDWLAWLTSADARAYEGAVLLPCADESLELLARHRHLLQPHFRLTEAPDRVVLDLLDKGRTYAIARDLGVPAPRFWPVRSAKELRDVQDQVSFPCLLKPRHSHALQRHTSAKMFLANDGGELRDAFARAAEWGVEVGVTEIIPGSEDRYCSFYTYLDEKLEPLFHFTKRKPRQLPLGTGTGTYHVTDWNPRVAELGLRFLQGAGLQGIGNPEFKLDPRDGELKLIECNLRFTGCNEILIRSGLDLPRIVYNRLTGAPVPTIAQYERGVRVFIPYRDYLAFRQLRRRGEVTLTSWLRSLWPLPHFLFFNGGDPIPSIAGACWFAVRQLRKRILGPIRRLRNRSSSMRGSGAGHASGA